MLKLGYIHENNYNIGLSKELNVCKMGLDTMIAIYLWSCYLFLVILIILFNQTKSWNLVWFGQIS